MRRCAWRLKVNWHRNFDARKTTRWSGRRTGSTWRQSARVRDLSRPKFTSRFSFGVKTLVKWETGERQPEGPARAYLLVTDRAPQEVRRALETA